MLLPGRDARLVVLYAARMSPAFHRLKNENQNHLATQFLKMCKDLLLFQDVK